MKITKRQAWTIVGLMWLSTLELVPIFFLMKPAFQTHNFTWLILNVLVIIATWMGISYYTRPFIGEKGMVDPKSKKLNAAWLYGKLTTGWTILQFGIFFLLIPQMGNGSYWWRIGIACEALLTFAALYHWMGRIADRVEEKNKGQKIWSSFMMLTIILILFLNAQQRTTDPNKVIDESAAWMMRNEVLMGAAMAVFFVGLMIMTFKEVRRQRLALKNEGVAR